MVCSGLDTMIHISTNQILAKLKDKLANKRFCSFNMKFTFKGTDS